MNRQTILASIHHQLRESFSESGEVRPLGEIVQAVAADIRAHNRPDAKSDATTLRVIPIEQVAAFVDGRLNSDDAGNVCQAAMVDNSVLAELIAAVRATHCVPAQLPPLSEALSAQLMAMRSNLPPAVGNELGVMVPSHKAVPLAANDVVVPPPPVEVFAATTSNGRVHSRAGRKRHPIPVVLAIAALAAGVAAVVFLANRDPQRTPQDHQLVNQGRSTLDEPNHAVSPDTDSEPTGDGNEVMVVGVEPDTSAEPRAVAPAIPKSQKPPQPDTVAKDHVGADAMRPEFTELPQLDHRAPVTPSTPPPPRLAALRWTDVTGLLARRDLSTTGATAPRVGGWKSVDTSSSELDPASGEPVSLRTMPLSRAQADLVGGGRIVLAADSGLQVSGGGRNSSAIVDLLHGEVAIIDLPNGTVIDLRIGDAIIASLRWSDHASAIVQRVAMGLQVHVNNGTIAINDQPHNDESVAVGHDRSVQTIDRPKRLPAWVDRPVDSIGIPRTILAQIAATDNVTRTLNQQINDIASSPRQSASDQRTLATLANWEAAMADTNLYRLFGSRVSALRFAAMQRLVYLPPTDARYLRTWNAIERMTGNQQRVAQFRRWSEMVRSGLKPNASQVEQMILGLSSQDVGSRTMSDFMLRQFYGNAVPFDPTWTGQQQQRAINVWRQRIGLPASRGAAAVAPNPP